MIGSAIDAERLAALIDGRLSQGDREALLARLAASSNDDDVDVFSDALAVTRELEEGAGNELRLADRAKRATHWRRPAGWIAIAATIVGVALLPTWWRRTQTADDTANLGRFALALAEPGRGLPADWNAYPWGTTRGAPTTLSPRARAVRVGARATDLELAARAADPRTPELAGDVVALLDGIPGAAPATAEYRALAAADSGSSAQELTNLAERARDAAAPFFDRDYLELGAWLEAARYAAARRDTAFFMSDAARDAIDRAREIRTLPPLARMAIDSLRGAGTNRARDWDALGRRLTTLLGALGS